MTTARILHAIAAITFALCAWLLAGGRWYFTLLGLLVLSGSLVVLPVTALAACSSTTVYMPDGSMKVCTTCCNGSACDTYCY